MPILQGETCGTGQLDKMPQVSMWGSPGRNPDSLLTSLLSPTASPQVVIFVVTEKSASQGGDHHLRASTAVTADFS